MTYQFEVVAIDDEDAANERVVAVLGVELRSRHVEEPITWPRVVEPRGDRK